MNHYAKPLLLVVNWIGGVLVFAGSWVLAQASFESIDRLVGGSIIIVAGAFIIRWVLKTSERVEATWSGAVEAANQRAEAAETQCASLRSRLEEMSLKYDKERSLRVSLEEMGMTDRRRRPDAAPESV